MRHCLLPSAAFLRLPALLVAATTVAQAQNWVPVPRTFPNPATGKVLFLDRDCWLPEDTGLELGYRIVSGDEASTASKAGPDPDLALPFQLAPGQSLQCFYPSGLGFPRTGTAVIQVSDDKHSLEPLVLKLDESGASWSRNEIAEAAGDSKAGVLTDGVPSGDTPRMKATVKFFDQMKGYGFLIGSDGKETFVHQTEIIAGGSGYRGLLEGEEVEYDLQIKMGKDGVEGRRALKVTGPNREPIVVPDPRPSAKRKAAKQAALVRRRAELDSKSTVAAMAPTDRTAALPKTEFVLLSSQANSPALETTQAAPQPGPSSRTAPNAPGRIPGIVKWFDNAKGIGFIRPVGAERDVFVHQTDIHAPNRYRTLTSNEEVLFTLGARNGQPRAVNVRSRSEGVTESSLKLPIPNLAQRSQAPARQRHEPQPQVQVQSLPAPQQDSSLPQLQLQAPPPPQPLVLMHPFPGSSVPQTASGYFVFVPHGALTILQ